MLRRLLIACVVADVACGPTNPTAMLNLQVGQYILIVSPSGDCTGFWPGVGTLLTLSRQGRDWVALSSSAADGNVELRFHEVANSLVAGVAVSGSLVGKANERRAGFTAASGTVSFSGPGGSGSASVAAETAPMVSTWITGRVIGQIVFTDTARGTLSCQSAEMALRPPSPCDLDATLSCTSGG